MPPTQAPFAQRWPILGRWPEAVAWLEVEANLGLAPRTLEAYARGVADYFSVCTREAIDPLMAERAEVARYVRDLTKRPSHRGANVVALDSAQDTSPRHAPATPGRSASLL